jgi:hypothetical protein
MIGSATRWPRTPRRRVTVGLTLVVAMIALVAVGIQSVALLRRPPQGHLLDPPFGASSPWNTPIPDEAVVDPATGPIVAHLTSRGGGIADLYAYGTPVLLADSQTPRLGVTCPDAGAPCQVPGGVPIPPGTQLDSVSDKAMVIIDTDAATVYDLWRPRHSANGLTASWASAQSLSGAGTGAEGVPGAQPSALAGLVRTYEIEGGLIDHALVFGSDNVCATSFRKPASSSMGGSSAADCIPQGTRVQLDPKIDLTSIPGITPAERAVGRALQVYGAYCLTNASVPMTFFFELPVGQEDPYPRAGLTFDYATMPRLPWGALRVLAVARSR